METAGRPFVQELIRRYTGTRITAVLAGATSTAILQKSYKSFRMRLYALINSLNRVVAGEEMSEDGISANLDDTFYTVEEKDEG